MQPNMTTFKPDWDPDAAAVQVPGAAAPPPPPPQPKPKDEEGKGEEKTTMRIASGLQSTWISSSPQPDNNTTTKKDGEQEQKKRGRKRKEAPAAATNGQHKQKQQKRTAPGGLNNGDRMGMFCWEIMGEDTSFNSGSPVGLASSTPPRVMAVVEGAPPSPLPDAIAAIGFDKLSKKQVLEFIQDGTLTSAHCGMLGQVRDGEHPCGREGIFWNFVWTQNGGRVYQLMPKEAKKLLGVRPSPKFRKELECDNRTPQGRPLYPVDLQFWDFFHLDAHVNSVSDARRANKQLPALPASFLGGPPQQQQQQQHDDPRVEILQILNRLPHLVGLLFGLPPSGGGGGAN